MKNEWISVSDKLPDNVIPVLVFGYCCDMCYNYKIAETEDGEWFEFGTGENLTFKPSHWMPLPKAPKKHEGII